MDVHLHQGHLWHAVSGGAVPPGEQLLLAANGSASRPVLAVKEARISNDLQPAS
jgi:hypothetical protein